MAEKHSIYDCPYCGKKSFNPLTKALAGNMNTKGRVCKACGRRAVNGKTSAIVRMVLMVVAIIIVFVTYFIESSDAKAYLIMAGTIIVAWLLSMLFDAFFCPLEPIVAAAIKDAANRFENLFLLINDPFS